MMHIPREGRIASLMRPSYFAPLTFPPRALKTVGAPGYKTDLWRASVAKTIIELSIVPFPNISHSSFLKIPSQLFY